MSLTPPHPSKPKLFELCKQLRALDGVSLTSLNDNVAPVEAVPVDTSTVEVSTLQDTILAPVSET